MAFQLGLVVGILLFFGIAALTIMSMESSREREEAAWRRRYWKDL